MDDIISLATRHGYVLQSIVVCGKCVTDTCAGIASLGTSKGLLELYYLPADSSSPYVSGNDYSAPGIGFGHVSFTVPDVAEALERVRGFGFEVIKPLDEAKTEQIGMLEEIV
jgi:lactoylglutathione lyase